MNLPHNIWAVGRNYADHARELGNAVPSNATGEPMIFLKAGSSVVASGGEIRLPSWAGEIHHELEIALRFGPGLEFSHFAIALDLTAREVQNRLKSQGHPWTLAKSFRDSCPLGAPLDIASIPGGVDGLDSLAFRLLANGELRQKGHPRDMIYKPRELRAYVVERFPVQEGDWLLTGTPAGVAPLRSGDRLEAFIDGHCQEFWTVR